MTGKGQCVESEKVKSQFRHLRYSEEKSILAGITEQLTLIVFTVDPRGTLSRNVEVCVNCKEMICLNTVLFAQI